MKLTRKLIPALAMLLIAAIVATSASYAWFTMSDKVSAAGMGLTATGPSSIEIANASVGPFAAATTLSTPANALLSPVSSLTGLSGSFFTVSKVNTDGTPDATGTITNASSVVQADNGSGNVLKYTLYMRNMGSTPVNITWDTPTISGTSYTRVAISSFADGIEYYTYDATSHSYTKNSTYTSGTVYYTKADSSNLEKCVRFSVSNATYDNAGIQASATFVSEKNMVIPTGASYKGEDGITRVVGTIASTTNHIGTVDSHGTDGSSIFTLPADGTVVTVTVLMWIEGQDASCVDAVALDTVTATIAFKVANN